jgi:hypothetical protein
VFGRPWIELVGASKQRGQFAVLSVLGVAAVLAALGWWRLAYLRSESFPAPLLYFGLQSFDVPRTVWFLAGAVLFLAWSPELFAGSSRIPTRSVVMLSLLTALTLLHLWASWEYAVSYRGWLAVAGIAALSAVPLLVPWALYKSASRRPTFGSNLLFHATVFAWLTTLAFPSISELP